LKTKLLTSNEKIFEFVKKVVFLS